MGQAVLPGNPPIEIVLRRSRASRRLSLRVSRLDGRVTLSMPKRTPVAEALAFARAQEEWLRSRLSVRDPGEVPGIGSNIPFEGRLLPVVAASTRRVIATDDAMLVPADPDRVAARIAAFLKLRARDRLAAASDRHADALDRVHRGITLRDTRSRWGSCSTDGRLMYSWRLILAPPDVLDYVAAHEVAHLVEMNHAPRFWAVVERLCPDYRDHRQWLRERGAALHRWRFET